MFSYFNQFFYPPEGSPLISEPTPVPSFRTIIESYNSSKYDGIPGPLLTHIFHHFPDDNNPPTHQDILNYLKEHQNQKYYQHSFRLFRLFREDIPFLTELEIDQLAKRFEQIYPQVAPHQFPFRYLIKRLLEEKEHPLAQDLESPELQRYDAIWETIEID